VSPPVRLKPDPRTQCDLLVRHLTCPAAPGGAPHQRNSAEIRREGIFSSLHISIGLAIIAVVVGEYLGASQGIGYVIAQAEGVLPRGSSRA